MISPFSVIGKTKGGIINASKLMNQVVNKLKQRGLRPTTAYILVGIALLTILGSSFTSFNLFSISKF